MSVLRGKSEPLSVYGLLGMVFFFVGGAAVVVAAALGLEWLCVLWGVSWVASAVMAVVGSVKS